MGEVIGLLHLGQIRLYLEDDAQANSYLDECLGIAREIKHQEVEGECELVLGEVAFHLGDRGDLQPGVGARPTQRSGPSNTNRTKRVSDDPTRSSIQRCFSPIG